MSGNGSERIQTSEIKLNVAFVAINCPPSMPQKSEVPCCKSLHLNMPAMPKPSIRP